MIEREQVPEGGWYTEPTREWWNINQRSDMGDGDRWIAQTGRAMEETADEICNLHNEKMVDGFDGSKLSNAMMLLRRVSRRTGPVPDYLKAQIADWLRRFDYPQYILRDSAPPSAPEQNR